MNNNNENNLKSTKSVLENAVLGILPMPFVVQILVLVMNHGVNHMWDTMGWGNFILSELPTLVLFITMYLLIQMTDRKVFLFGVIPASITFTVAFIGQATTSITDAWMYAIICSLLTFASIFIALFKLKK